MTNYKPLKYTLVAGLLLAVSVLADPVSVRQVQGFSHGFVVLKDLNDKILASGDSIQIPRANRITTTLTLHFKDGSLYREISVFSQRRTYRLLSYKQVQKGPAFKTQETLSFDTSTGNVNVRYTDKDGKAKAITTQISLPTDLANGIITTLLGNVDPKVETTLSMLVATPKPRIVKLKISASGQDSFSLGGSPAKATRYIVNIDIGGITGAVAKAIGKQPPPTYAWISTGKAPTFLRSEGPLYNEGPIWRVELASPTWRQDSQRQ